MNDIASLPNVGRDMIEKAISFWLVTVSFHSLRLVDDNEMLVLINLLNEVWIAQRISFGDNLPRQKSTGKCLV